MIVKVVINLDLSLMSMESYLINVVVIISTQQLND